MADLTATVPADLMPAFRRFFGVHVFLNTLKLPGQFGGQPLVPVVIGVVLLGTLAALTRGWLARLGLVVLLVYKGFFLVTQFPMTANHLYVECLILLLLLLFPERAGPVAGGEADGTACHLIQLLILSLYFFSGVQKLTHGFWLNGEYIGQSLYSGGTLGIWASVQVILEAIAKLTGAPLGKFPFEQSADLARASVVVPTWTLFVFLPLSWLAVASEIAVPLMVFSRRTRRLGLFLMLGTIALIGALSWEIEFLFVAVGCVLLFFSRRPGRNYLSLIGVHVAWSLFVLWAGLRIWIL